MWPAGGLYVTSMVSVCFLIWKRHVLPPPPTPCQEAQRCGFLLQALCSGHLPGLQHHLRTAGEPSASQELRVSTQTPSPQPSSQDCPASPPCEAFTATCRLSAEEKTKSCVNDKDGHTVESTPKGWQTAFGVRLYTGVQELKICFHTLSTHKNTRCLQNPLLHTHIIYSLALYKPVCRSAS